MSNSLWVESLFGRTTRTGASLTTPHLEVFLIRLKNWFAASGRHGGAIVNLQNYVKLPQTPTLEMEVAPHMSRGIRKRPPATLTRAISVWKLKWNPTSRRGLVTAVDHIGCSDSGSGDQRVWTVSGAAGSGGAICQPSSTRWASGQCEGAGVG